MAPNNDNTPQKGNNNSSLSPGNSPFSPSTQKISNKTKINVTPSMANPSCETCGSTNDCEEDIDNPGDYYCKSCWEEYGESQQLQEKGGGEMLTKNSDDLNGDDKKCQEEENVEEKGMALNLTSISNVNENVSNKDDIDSSRSSFPSTSQFLTPRGSSLGTQPPESSQGDESASLCVSTQPQLQTQALSEVGGLALSSSTQPPLSSSQEALVEFATQADYDTPLESSGDHSLSAELKKGHGGPSTTEKEVEEDQSNGGKIPDKDNKSTETDVIDVEKNFGAVGEKNNTDAQSDVVNIEGNANKKSGDAAESNNETMNNAGIDAKSLSGRETYEKRSVIFEAAVSAHQNDDDSSDDDDEDGASIRTQEDNFANSKGSGSETGGGLLTQAADDDDDEDSEEEDDNKNTNVKEGDDTIRDEDVHENDGEVKFAQDIIKGHESKAGDQSPMIEAVTTADSQQKGMTLSGLTEPTQPENDKPSVSSPAKAQTLSKPTDDEKEPLTKENATASNDLADDASSAYDGLSEEEKEEEVTDVAAANVESTEDNKAKDKSAQQEQVAVNKDASSNSPPPEDMQPAKDDNANNQSTTQLGQDNKPTLGNQAPVAKMNDDDDDDEDEIMEGTGDTIVGSASEEGWSLYAGDTQMLPTGPSQPVDSTSSQLQKADIDTDAKSKTEVSANQDVPGNVEPAIENANADAAFDKETQPLLDKSVAGEETVDPATNKEGEGDTNACILEEPKAAEDQQNVAFRAIKHTPENGSLPISYPNDESPLKNAPTAMPPVDDARQDDDAMDEDDDGEETQLYSQDLLSPAKSKEDSPQRPAVHSPKRTASINNGREKSVGLGKDDIKGSSSGGSKTGSTDEESKLAKTLGQNDKETKWMSSSRHQEKDDSDDCSSRSPRLQIPSFKPIRKSSDEEPPTKKPTENEDNVSESDEESLSGNGHNYEADPIENTQDEHEHETKRSSAFKRISRSARDDSSTKFSPRTSERRISKVNAASNGTDRVIKPKVLRYESVTKNDDASEASKDSHSSSEAEFNDDGNVDVANSINQFHLSQTDQRVKEQLEEVKAMLPSAEQIQDITSRKELLDEIAKLKKYHKAAIKRLKNEKSELASKLENAEEIIKKKDQKFKREKGKLVAQLKSAEETITLKDQTIKEKNSLLEEQFKVIEQIKGLQNHTRTPPPATTTASKKRKKKELPPESESDSSDDDGEGDEMPISALKNAPAPSSNNKKRRKKSYGSRQAKLPAMGEERTVSPKVAAVTHRSGDTSSVETTLASNQTNAKQTKSKSTCGSVERSSANSDNNISVLSSDVWKKLQEKGWKYQTGPEPYNKVYVPKDGATHTGTQLGIHFFDNDGVIAAAVERGDLTVGKIGKTSITNVNSAKSAKSSPVLTKKKKISEHPPVHYPGHTILESDTPLDDSKLVGKLKLITLESAQASINFLANFMKENDHDRFVGHIFSPLWTRLKDQGSELGLNWRYDRYSNALSPRNWCFVPPSSKLGVKGKVGKDFFITEEHVVLCVLNEISTMKQVSHLVAQHEESFSTIVPVLTRAVEENLEYKDAKRGASASVRTRRIKSTFQPGEQDSPVKKSSPKSGAKRKSPQQKTESAAKRSASKKRKASKITPETKVGSSTKKQKSLPQSEDEEHLSPSFHMSQTQAVVPVSTSSYNRRSPGNNNGPLNGLSFFYSGIDPNFHIEEKIKRLGGKIAKHTSFTNENAHRNAFFLADYTSWRKLKYIYAAALGAPMLHYKWLVDLEKKYKENEATKPFDSELYIKHRLPTGLDLEQGYYPLQRASNARAWDPPGMRRGEGSPIFHGMTIALAIDEVQEHEWTMVLTACGANVKTLSDIQKGMGRIDVDCCLFASTSLPPHVVSTPVYVSQLMQFIGDDVPLLDLAWAHQSIIQRQRLPLVNDDDDRYTVTLDHTNSNTCLVSSIKSKGIRYEIGDLVQFSRGGKATARGRIASIIWERHGKGCKLEIQLLDHHGGYELVDCPMSARITVDESSLQGNILMLGAKDFDRLGYLPKNPLLSNIFNRHVPTYESQM